MSQEFTTPQTGFADEATLAKISSLAERIFLPVAGENWSYVAAACLQVTFAIYKLAGVTREQAEHVTQSYIKSYLQGGN